MPSKPLSLLLQLLHPKPPKQGNMWVITTPLGPTKARVWGHMFFIRRSIIIFPTIGMLVLIPVMAGTDRKPEYIINRVRLLLGMVTDAAFLLELTGTILETWKLLLTGWKFLSQVDKLSSILMEIPDT